MAAVGGRVDEEEKGEGASGSNATDGCHFCDYAPTFFTPFRGLYFSCS